MNLFNLMSKEGNLLIEAAINETEMLEAIIKMKEESSNTEYPESDEEILKEILKKRNIDFNIINPIIMEW